MRAKLFSSRTISAVLIAGLSMGNLGFGSIAQAQSPAGQKPLDNQSNVPQQVSPGPLQPQPSTQPPADDKELPNAPSATTQPSTVVLGPDGKPVPSTTAHSARPAASHLRLDPRPTNRSSPVPPVASAAPQIAMLVAVSTAAGRLAIPTRSRSQVPSRE